MCHTWFVRQRGVTDEQLQQARDLVAAGYSARGAARKLGVSQATLSRKLRRDKGLSDPAAAPPPPVPPPPDAGELPEDPRARLQAIRDGWLRLAELGQAELLRRLEQGTGSNVLTYQTGISSRNALEASTYLDRGYGLPEHLPPDDVEARRLLLDLWYQHARHGSQSATVKLAAALGVRSAAAQPVRIAYADEKGDEEDGGPDDHAAPPATAPAGDPQLP